MLPSSWGAKSGQWRQEPAEGAPAQKLPFEVKLTFFVSVILFYPVALCILLHSRISVQYWVGHWVLYAAAIVPLWVLACHCAIARALLKRSSALFLVLILPAALLAAVSQVQSWQFSSVGAALVSTDCRSFLGKADLERAWWQAHDVFKECTSRLSEITGAGLRETALMTNFKDCPGYREGAAEYGKDWGYLERVEQAHHCGGWCSPQRPLWIPEYKTLDGCALVVARSMLDRINFLSQQVMVYSLIVLMCASLTLITNPSWLRDF